MFIAVAAYLLVALCLGVYVSVRNIIVWKIPGDFPEDFYTLLGYCLCWPLSVPHNIWRDYDNE